MIAVALIGLDGAGKTTVGRELERRLPVPARYLYMGVNPAASTVSLPTTRLVHAVRKRRGTVRSGPIVPEPAPPPTKRGPARRAVRSVRTVVATANQIAEEVYRQVIAWRCMRRGEVAILDRHFAADFAALDPTTPRPGLVRRLHDRIRTQLYPAPDVVVLLDASAEVVFARKGEGTVDWLARRREGYLRFAQQCRGAVVIDAEQPVDAVVEEIEALVLDALEARRDA